LKDFARQARAAELLDDLGKSFKGAVAGASFRSALPTIVACMALAMTSFLSLSAGADGLDLSLGGSFRSYALSGTANVDAGYGQRVWGDPSTPFFGYIRPQVSGYTAGTYNSLNGALEVFPLAFLGARAGGEAIQNDSKYTAYDCETYRCKGRFYRSFLETELSLGAGPLFAQARWRRERWSQPHAQGGDFIDPTSGLVMLSSGESQTVYYGVAGWNLNPTWALLAALRYAESVDGGRTAISRMPFASVRYRRQGWSFIVGGGTFESTFKKRDFTALAMLSWEIFPAIGLH
jgi:hypothetical protein